MTPMPASYTCACGLYVHPVGVNVEAIHTEDCPYGAAVKRAAEVSACPVQPRYACAYNRFFCRLHSTLAERLRYHLDRISWEGFESVTS